ncbi:MAG: hypothetical protein RJA59_505 [Pseudomonadota bacterium]
MRPTQRLHDLGQSIWLDNITRDLLDTGTLARWVDELSITGLTSNPSIFEQALKTSAAYDEAIRAGVKAGRLGEDLFFDLALQDLTRAADVFRAVHERTGGVDGFVSLEVSPLLAYDAAATLRAARELFDRAGRPNLHIKIPGTREGLPAIEEATFAGIPVNVTLLFSPEQYVAAAEAWLRGVERRIAAGLAADVRSVASVFVSRWDVAVAAQVPPELRNRLGNAIMGQTYAASRRLHASARWQRVMNAGARPQRVLWASTGTKDPAAPDTLYVTSLAAPYTVNTMPEKTLLAFADHGTVGEAMAADGGDADAVVAAHARAGVDVDALASRLQADGAKAFVKSWNELIEGLARKTGAAGKDR